MSEMWEMDGPPGGDRRYASPPQYNGRRTMLDPSTSDLHAWSIYRQNINSDFTDSALGSDERSPLPYGNFQLREQTVQAILNNPRLRPRTELLQSNVFSYLKFGLPRVLPPRMKDGVSSGYESPPDDDRRARSRNRDRRIPTNPSRARSEADVTDGMLHNRFRRKNPGKSQLRPAQSEGNILNSLTPPPPPSQASVWMGTNGRGPSPSLLSGDRDTNQRNIVHVLPHLQVRSLSVVGNGGTVVEGLSFDLRGGEMMALMTTNEREGRMVLEALAGRRPSSGQFILNGNELGSGRLGRRVGFVRRDNRLHPHLSLRETLFFYGAFKRTTKETTSKSMVDEVLDYLSLSGIGSSSISSLTNSEKQRLVVGCQLILDNEILLLDGPTKAMDIFDTFYLVSLIEEWTRNPIRPKIGIITIHPPTFEIFCTFSKVVLLSTGRTIFSGHRREMLPYFAFIDYPCPPFKNPSDYYIDLVTRDTLSPEALLESTQRIEALGEAWSRRDEGLQEPGPPHPLPPPTKHPSGVIFSQILFLLIHKYWGLAGIRSRFLKWFTLILISGSLSVILGGIYWEIRLDSPAHVNSAYDRLGCIWALLAIIPQPILLLLLSNEEKEWDYLTRDTEEDLYSKAAHFLAQTVGEFPFVICVLIALSLPHLAMGGVKDTSSLFLILGYAILCLYALHCITRGIFQCVGGGLGGGCLGLLVLFVLGLSSGYPIHKKDIGDWVFWTQVLSPTAWILPPIAIFEFNSKTTFEVCSNPIVEMQPNIMRELNCGLGKGENVLAHYDFKRRPVFLQLLQPIAVILISHFITLLALLTKRQRKQNPPPQKP